MKRSQLAGQPFIYIFAIVVAALIIIFGVKAVRDTLSIGEKVEINVLIENLDKEVSSCLNLDYGSSCSLDKLRFNSNIKEVCFVNIDQDIDYDGISDNTIKEIIRISVSSNENDNLFFIPVKGKELEKVKGYVPNLRSNENPLCARVVNSRVSLVLENKGNFVEIKKI